MADDSRGLVLEILKQIQATLVDLQQRLGRVEQIAARQGRDLAGMLMMMRSVPGDFDQRVIEVEERVRVPEEQRTAG